MKRTIRNAVATLALVALAAPLPASAVEVPAEGFHCDQPDTLATPPLQLDDAPVRRRAPRLGSFNIVIVAGPTLAANAPALAAFERAAAQWEARFSDPITVEIHADFGNLGTTGTLGSTSTEPLQLSYAAARSVLVADAADESDDDIMASLPSVALLVPVIPSPYSFSGNVLFSKANLKAIGFDGADLDTLVGTTSDGTITFNTNYTAFFDYDRTNGIGGSLLDFESIAAHEIGHLLGFMSGVDLFDAATAAGTPAQALPIRVLDLLRFRNDNSINDPATAADFSLFVRSLTYNTDDITDDIAAEWRMSTGAANGDGRQASHWKDDGITGTLVGVMDPTASLALSVDVGTPDVRALDLIGYDFDLCGNGTVDAGETCDDSNRTDGDCCSSECQADVSGTACASDGNSCTNDVCNGAGACSHVLKPNFSSCDDGLFCTTAEYCLIGTCIPAGGTPCVTECNTTCNEATDSCLTPAGVACSSDGNACTNDACNGSGSCAHTPNTAPCTSDGNECTGDVCSGGSCTHPATSGPCTDDGSECTDDVCAGGSCTHPANTGDACTDDGNPCTDDICDLTGACAHPANTAPCADDGNACTGDVCSGGSCTHPANSAPCADDGNACTGDVCSGGACTHPANSAPCDDGVFCNGADTCADGTCSGHAGTPCDDGSVCGGTCDEDGDTCIAPSGTPCDDGLYCNGADSCSGGSCSVHDGDPCAGGGECLDTCDEAGDSCLTPAGTACTDDGDSCTLDECDGSGSCEHPFDAGGVGCSVCPAEPQEDCLTGLKAVVGVVNSADPAGDKFTWKWLRGQETTMADFGSPSVDTSYRLCFYSYDSGVATLTSEGLVGAGARWTESPSKGWTYKDKTAASAGVSLIKLKVGAGGKSLMLLKGKGASLAVPPPVGAEYFWSGSSVIVQLANSTGQCWATAFRGVDVAVNTAAKAKVVDEIPFCGDGLRDPTEQCDGTDNSACSSTCETGVCYCTP